MEGGDHGWGRIGHTHNEESRKRAPWTQPWNEWSNREKAMEHRAAAPAASSRAGTNERARRDDAKLSGKSSAGSGRASHCLQRCVLVGSAGKGMGDVKQRLQKVGLGRDASVGQNVLSKEMQVALFFLEGFEGSRVCSYTDNPSLGLGSFQFSTFTHTPPLTQQESVACAFSQTALATWERREIAAAAVALP